MFGFSHLYDELLLNKAEVRERYSPKIRGAGTAFPCVNGTLTTGYDGRVIFNSECTRNRLPAGLYPDPLGELTTLPRTP